MRLKGKKVLVYGLGSSGQEACRILHDHGACVSLYDDDKRFSGLFCYEREPQKQRYDLVIVSPGVKVRGNDLITYFMRTTHVMSELDFGYEFVKGKIIGISGTNGKTTVCSLLGKIFDDAGRKNFVCGNIGLPLCTVAEKTDKKTITIVEVSNFQLELSENFRPNVACVLNITEDHTDRHGSFQEYKRVKAKLFKNLKGRDAAVVNLDDDESLSLPFSKRKIFFSKRELDKGAYLKNGFVYFNKKKIMLASEISLLGEKNLENVLCCIAIARKFKIKPQIIRKSIASFKAPSHRLEYVCDVNGAKVYNDSKSTNVACTLMAIEALRNQNIILMLGGRNKDNDFETLFSKNFSAKKILTFGECAKEIKFFAEKYNQPCQDFEKMEFATRHALEIAEQDDVILFSPACSSFDEFSSYSARGQRFKEIVMGQE